MELTSRLDLVDVPVRLLLDPEALDASTVPIYYYGKIVAATDGSLLIRLRHGSTTPTRAALIRVEALHPHGLLRFVAWAEPLAGRAELSCTWSESNEVELVQRRRHVRIAISVDCQLCFASQKGKAASFTGRIRNLSAGGLALTLHVPIKQDDRCLITLPEHLPLPQLPLLAEVIRVTPEADTQLVALRFVDLQPWQESMLTAFIDAHQ